MRLSQKLVPLCTLLLFAGVSASTEEEQALVQFAEQLGNFQVSGFISGMVVGFMHL